MLIRFVVSNFLSFKEETEFNMLTGKGNGYTKHINHVNNVSSNVNILKLAAIYGANASGKSNFIKALEYFKNLIHEENVENLIPLSKRFRVDKEYRNLPTSFRIEYTYNKIHFDYGLEIHKGKIIEEWLYKIDDIKKEQEQLLFKRNTESIEFGDFFKEDNISYLKKYLNMELKEDQTVLNASFSRVENNDIIDIANMGIINIVIVTPNSVNRSYPAAIINREIKDDFASSILRTAETGIESLVIKEIGAHTYFSYNEEDYKNELIEKIEELIENTDTDNPDELSILFYDREDYNTFKKVNGKYVVNVLKTKHNSCDELFDFTEESDGTNRLFELTPAFDHLINDENTVFIIDELERSLHPILVKELVRLFSHSKTKNNQLIFTTHESQLLDLEIFRQDEIWFTEKKIDGSSEFYPLSKFKPREDKNIKRGYLQGRYGGIPFLGDFSKLINKNE